MAKTLVEWSESDEVCLVGVQGRMQAMVPQRPLSRPDVLRVLVRAAAGNVGWEKLLAASVADTIPPEGG